MGLQPYRMSTSHTHALAFTGARDDASLTFSWCGPGERSHTSDFSAKRSHMSNSIRAAVTLTSALLLPLAFDFAESSTVIARRSTAPTVSTNFAPQVGTGLRAGLRASNYGITPFPSPSW